MGKNMSNRFVLGLDLGIASCGYALLDFKGHKIVKSGVVAFQKPEDDKSGSYCKVRRTFRSMRRNIRRKAQRMKALKKLMYEYKLLTELTNRFAKDINPWDLRTEALNRKLEPFELAKILLHIAKHRGYKPTSKDQEESKTGKKKNKKDQDNSTKEAEQKKVLAALKVMEKDYEKTEFLTIGSFLASKEKQRNGNEEYQNSIYRHLNESEVKLILEKQESFGFTCLSKKFKTQYLNLAFSQRPLRSFENMVGMCPYEPEEKRAPKNSHTAEKYQLIQKVLLLEIRRDSGEKLQINSDEIKNLSKEGMKRSSLNFKQIRSILKIDAEFSFYKNGYKVEKENSVFFVPKGTVALKQAFKKINPELWDAYSTKTDKIDKLISTTSYNKDLKTCTKKIKDLFPELTKEMIHDIFEKISDLSGTSNLSTVCMKKIIPHMEKGMHHIEAIKAAGYPTNLSNLYEKNKIVPPIELTKNPVVDRAMANARKLVNSLIREYGTPDLINIENTREFGQSLKERKKMQDYAERKGKKRKSIIDNFKTLANHEPSSKQLLKYEYWLKQHEECMYSGKKIPFSDLLESKEVEIDHVIPYSRCFRHSQNKVLVLASENQKKGNQTPYEYFGNDKEKWKDFEKRVNKHYAGEKVRSNLLRKSFNKSDEEEWKERNLTDTAYITRKFAQHLKNYLDLKNPNNIYGYSARIISDIRYRWGFKKDRKDNKHHAVDAVVTACMSPSLVKKFEFFLKNKDMNRKYLEIEKPWKNFHNDVIDYVKKINITRVCKRRLKGSAHQSTLYSKRTDSDGNVFYVSSMRLSKVNLKHLENLYQKERNWKIYETLKKRLTDSENNPKNAFAEPIYMPQNNVNAEKIPIKSVKIIQTDIKSGILFRTYSEKRAALVKNGDIARCDVYIKNGEYFFSPIYVSDLTKKNPPKFLASSSSKDLLCDESYAFVMTLNRHETIEVEKPSGEKVMVKFYSINRCSLGFKYYDLDDNSNNWKTMGKKHLKKMIKYETDYLGRHFKKEKEKFYWPGR